MVRVDYHRENLILCLDENFTVHDSVRPPFIVPIVQYPAQNYNIISVAYLYCYLTDTCNTVTHAITNTTTTNNNLNREPKHYIIISGNSK